MSSYLKAYSGLSAQEIVHWVQDYKRDNPFYCRDLTSAADRVAETISCRICDSFFGFSGWDPSECHWRVQAEVRALFGIGEDE